MLEKDSKYWFLNSRSANSVSKKVKSKAHLIGICDCKRLAKVIQLFDLTPLWQERVEVNIFASTMLNRIVFYGVWHFQKWRRVQRSMHLLGFEEERALMIVIDIFFNLKFLILKILIVYHSWKINHWIRYVYFIKSIFCTD